MTTQQLYQTVTDSIVATLESGNVPAWRRPWAQGGGGFLPLRHAGQAYRGVNVLWLWCQAQAHGYVSPYWMTFKQALEYGGAVKKGEKATGVLFCQPVSKETTAADGTTAKDSFWIARSYNVFNCDQISGLPDRFTAKPVHQLDPSQRLANADTFIGNTHADIRYGSGGAYYRPSEDYINLPAFEAFDTPQDYASTAIHELCHWTGSPTRLDRDLKGFGNREAYSREECIAELGSVFACASLGIAPPDLGQHAAYLQHWITAMRQDPKYIFQVSSKAQASCDFLNSLQPQFPADQSPLPIAD